MARAGFAFRFLKPCAVAAFLALMTACGGGSSTPGGPAVASITISGVPSAPLVAPQTEQLGAIATFSDGSEKDVTTAATWQSTDDNVLTVSAAGLISALRAGTADVYVILNGVTNYVSIEVVVQPAAFFVGDVQHEFDYGLDAQRRVDRYRVPQWNECQGSLSAEYDCRWTAPPQYSYKPVANPTMGGEAGKLLWISSPGWQFNQYRTYVYGENGVSEVLYELEDGAINPTGSYRLRMRTTLRQDSLGRLKEVIEVSTDCPYSECFNRVKESRITLDSLGRLKHADHTGFDVDPVTSARTPYSTGTTDWEYSPAGWMVQVVSRTTTSNSEILDTVRYEVDADGWLLSRSRTYGATQTLDTYQISRSDHGILEEQFTQAEPGGFYDRRQPQRVRYEWGRLPLEPLFVPRGLTGLSGADYFGIISSHQRSGGDHAPQENAIAVFRDRTQFESGCVADGHASFDDVPSGTVSPFATRGVAVDLAGTPLAPAEVRDTLAEMPISFWFADIGSLPNFLLTNALAGRTLELSLPWSTFAIGVDIQCFACGANTLRWMLLDAAGNAVGSGETAVTWTFPTPQFFGLRSSKAFRSLSIGGASGNWLLDNVQYRLMRGNVECGWP